MLTRAVMPSEAKALGHNDTKGPQVMKDKDHVHSPGLKYVK